MEVLPVIFCLVLPLVLIVLAFGLGRWTASHQISVQRRGGAQSPFYEGFEEK